MEEKNKKRGNKILNTLVGIFLIIVIGFILDTCLQIRIDGQIKKYMEKNSTEQLVENISVTESQETVENYNITKEQETTIKDKATYEEVINLLFPFDGNYYVANENVKFYSDISCKDEYLIENPRFLSMQSLNVFRKEDHAIVNILILDDGTPCYSYSGWSSLYQE